ncbi:MAG: hypothetical protein P1V51_00490 [Deltaproteobacteria bacterium]|nr:hypothetical protein [Deltaproteobacteria bacterium]
MLGSFAREITELLPSRREALILAALTSPYLLVLWGVGYPIMQDLSGHLEVAHLLRELLGGNAFYAEYYRIQPWPWPNSAGVLLLAGLEGLVAPMTAAKLLLSGYLFFWTFALAAFAKSLKLSPLTALLGICAALDYNWTAGFFNWLLAKPFVLLVLALAIRYATERRRSQGIWVAALLCLTFVFHGMVWGYALGMAALTLVFWGEGRQRWRSLWVLAPSFGMMLPYLLSERTTERMSNQTLWFGPDQGFSHLWDYLGQLGSSNTDELAWLIPLLLLALAPLATLHDDWRRRRRTYLLLVIGGLMVTYLFGPMNVPDVSIISVRHLVYVWAMVICLPAIEWRRTFTVAAVAALLLAGTVHALGLRSSYLEFEARDMEGFRELIAQIPEERFLAVQYDSATSSFGRHAAAWHWPKHYTIEGGGLTNDSFAFRRTTFVTLKSEEGKARLTHSYLGADAAEYWDYLLVRTAGSPRNRRMIEPLTDPVGRAGTWRLYRYQR